MGTLIINQIAQITITGFNQSINKSENKIINTLMIDINADAQQNEDLINTLAPFCQENSISSIEINNTNNELIYSTTTYSEIANINLNGTFSDNSDILDAKITFTVVE